MHVFVLGPASSGKPSCAPALHRLAFEGKPHAAVCREAFAMTMMDEEVGPLLVAPPKYIELRHHIRLDMGFPHERLPLLIGIDGVDGAGKSSLSAWLSWQLEMPSVHLDLYMIPDANSVAFKSDQLADVVDARLTRRRPLIVEGVLLLDALAAIGREPDLLVFVEKQGHARRCPTMLAPTWYGKSPAHEQRTYWSGPARNMTKEFRAHTFACPTGRQTINRVRTSRL